MKSDYKPIDCGLHSRYELLAMRRARVVLHYRDEAEKDHRVRGRVVDVFTRRGAEYLRLKEGRGSLEVRLDHIIGFEEGC